MTATQNPQIGQIESLLAEHGYEVSEVAPYSLKVREVDSGVAIRAVLEGDILYFSLVCTVVPRKNLSAETMSRMLASDNGISASYFQLYEAGSGNVAVTLNNFCKLQDLGTDDQDDIISCVQFLLVDVMTAHRLIGDLQKQQ
jgi:hypothetical protein